MLKQIETYIHQARSITHLAHLLGVPRSTLRDYLTKNNLPTDSIDALRVSIQPAPTTQSNTLSINHINNLIQIAELKQQSSPVHQQYVFNIERPNEPVVFILWGDIHIGSAGVNHQAVKNEVEAIRDLRSEDPNIILALNGDIIDGYFAGSKHSNNDQVLTINEQREFAKWLLKELKPEIAISADHEAWSIDSGLELNFTKDFCNEHGINYAQWQAKLVVKFDNGLTRTILVNHRYPGRTALNPTKHLQKLHNERGPADIVCCGHYHSNVFCGWMNALRQNEDSFIAMQNGTHKILDSFASKIGDLVGEYGVPATVLMPNGDMYPFKHYSQAIDFKNKLSNK